MKTKGWQSSVAQTYTLLLRCAFVRSLCVQTTWKALVNLRIISIAAIAIGFILEIVLAGQQFGNGIAAIGIIVFVYDYFKRRQGPKF